MSLPRSDSEFGVPKLSEKMTFTAWDQVEASLTWIYEEEVKEIYLSQKHHISGQSGFLIREGEVTVANEKGHITAGSGQWVFPRNGDRLQQFTIGTRILSVHFKLSWPGNRPFFDWDVAAVVPAIDFPDLEREAKEIQHLVEEHGIHPPRHLRFSNCDWQTYLLIQNRFRSWLCHYSAALQSLDYVPMRLGDTDSRVLLVVQALDQHCLSTPFDEQELAKRLNLSAGRLARIFAKILDCTPRQYLERRRLDQALSRVQWASDPFKEIAFDLGFGSLSHFSSWVHRKTGFYPRELREQVQNPSRD